MRKTRGTTLEEIVFPTLPPIADLNHWSLKWSSQILEYTWVGYDLFRNEYIPKVDFSKITVFIEGGISEYLLPFIRKATPKDVPFDVEHEVDEFATAKAGLTPHYDIVFILRENRRLKYPLEAKALKDDTLHELEKPEGYIETINKRYLTGKYAPFSFEGAMLAYLLSGNSNNCLQNIEKSLKTKLYSHPDFPTRQHKFSDHKRNLSRVKNQELLKFCPTQFRIHHLILEMN